MCPSREYNIITASPPRTLSSHRAAIAHASTLQGKDQDSFAQSKGINLDTNALLQSSCIDVIEDTPYDFFHLELG